MAELADAADSKSAGTWYLGGSTPPPGTTTNYFDLSGLQLPFPTNIEQLFPEENSSL
jgi:hypothetical protein